MAENDDTNMEELNKTSSSDGFDLEYKELRSEQRFRYESLNKLNAGFITFTTAVLTIGFGLSAVVNGILNAAMECKVALQTATGDIISFFENKYLLYESVATGIEFLQALFFLTPVIYSKICFNHSLENNVRISLISSYLEANNPNERTWDSFRHISGIKYFFGSFGSCINDERVGDLSNMHRIISWLSIVLGLSYGITTFANCVMDGIFNDTKNFVLFIIICSGLFVSAVIHTSLVLSFKAQNINKQKTQYNPIEDEKEKLKTIEADATYQKKVNTSFTFILWGVVAMAYLAVVIFVYPRTTFFSNQFMEYMYALIFAMFGMFCIWQFPCYTLECNVADRKISIHKTICEKEANTALVNKNWTQK